MGRELKRVPLDFNWPLDKVWGGYLNPFWKQSVECEACGGSHLNAATHIIEETFYDGGGSRRWCDKITQEEVEALVVAGRLRDFTHAWSDDGWKPIDPPPVITAAQVNAWERGRGMGHDAINRWILVETRAKRLGVYGHCTLCDEDGRIWPSEEIRQQYKTWEPTPPPIGEGYQLWETTSEGSPQSPVFASLEELCAWAATNATTFGSSRATAERWREMLDDGYVYHQEGNAVFG